jgi:amino acid transporter
MNADQDPATSGSSDPPNQPNPTPPAPGVHKVPGKPEDPVVEVVHEVTEEEVPPEEEPGGIHETVKTLLVGKALSLDDKKVFSHISLIAFFAWVGLGADGLSSSCYGPEEAFLHLKGFEYLALFLAGAIVFTVIVISMCYSHIIEAFPSGGGGYLVASKMLGPRIGVISGCALVVDYVLTVTVSIAAAGNAMFGLLSLLGVDAEQTHQLKLWTETAAIVVLIVLNLRGVKESVTVLMPIFLIFLITHAILIFGVLGMHIGDVGSTVKSISTGISTDLARPDVGFLGLLFLLLKAYSLGAGTYTGIEAVSNSMPVLREPRIATAQRTMLYMAVSLALTAGGLMVAYLLLQLKAAEGGKTMNHVLIEQFVTVFPAWMQSPFVWIAMLSEAALLVVAAQAGFIDGPRCLANMAHDSWVPHWFGSLSERLATHNGILLIGGAALAALWANDGNVSSLLVMYAINVFLTFSLSMLGMCIHWWRLRGKDPLWVRRLTLFGFGLTMCASILAVTIFFKFFEGAWKTVVVTGLFVLVCYLIHRYYKSVTKRLKSLNESLGTIEIKTEPTKAPLRPQEPTAAILVGGYSGIGVHTLLNSLRFVPHHFQNIVFISVGVVDSGNFKGAEAVDDLRKFTEEALEKYVDLARRMGLPSKAYMTIGTDVVEELDQLCRVVAKDFPRVTVFAGQLVFQKETWYGPILHNQTAYSLQRRLQWDGIPMVILPTRVKDG